MSNQADIRQYLEVIPALSVRQPWAWMIIHGGKDIENRDWNTRFRGKVLIHAAKGCTRDEYEDAAWFAESQGIKVPPLKELERGGIVGIVDITDCVSKSDSPWFFGKFGFVLTRPKAIPFLPCKGALGFFKVRDVAGNGGI